MRCRAALSSLRHGINAENWVLRSPHMIDSEDSPLLTVGELARALDVPREFVYRHATELARFACVCQTTTANVPRSLNSAVRCVQKERTLCSAVTEKCASIVVSAA